MPDQVKHKRYGSTELIDVDSAGEAISLIQTNRPSKAIVRLTIDPAEMRADLYEYGFRFADRTLGATIPSRRLPDSIDKLIRMTPQNGEADKKECFRIAKEGLRDDTRFNVDPDKALFDSILQSWIDEIDTCLTCQVKGELAGFLDTIVIEEGTCLFVRLAATDSRFRLSGVALSLYATALKKAHDLGMKSLDGRISAKNVAALNLWTSLGAKLMEPRDIYLGTIHHV